MAPAILMDLWRTLIEPIVPMEFYYKARILELLRACGVSPSDDLLELAYSVYRNLEDELLVMRKNTLKEVPAQKALSMFFERLGLTVRVGERHLNAYSWPFLELTRLRDGARMVLENLSTEYTLILVSNIALTRMGKEVLRRNGLSSYFLATLFSDEVGYRKPHPKIFQLALQLAETSPHECIMVGDELEDDMFGAKNLGIRTIWVPWNRSHPRPPEYVDEVAYSLKDILKIVRRLMS